MSIHNYDRLEQYNKKNLDWFVVNWCMGNTCNYACSYCPVSLHDGSQKWQSIETVEALVHRIKRLHAGKKLFFEFTGGEVTLNKQFIDICKFCKKNDVRVGMISNGSRTVRWWQENKQYFDHVNLSFHVEYADPDHFCEVTKLICRELATHVNVMMHVERFDECLKLATRIKKIGNVSVSLQPLIHDLATDLYDYSNDQLYILHHQHEIYGNIRWQRVFDHYRGAMRAMNADGSWQDRYILPSHFVSNDTNNWDGWHCWAGVEQLIVDKMGLIWRGWCRVGGLIGHVSDLDLALPVEPVVCDVTRCHCNLDIMCSKARLPGGV